MAAAFGVYVGAAIDRGEVVTFGGPVALCERFWIGRVDMNMRRRGGTAAAVVWAIACGTGDGAGDPQGSSTTTAGATTTTSAGDSTTVGSSTADATTTSSDTEVDDATTASCEPEDEGGGAALGSESSTTEPECVPVWSGCAAAEPLELEIDAELPVAGLLPAPDGAVTLVGGHPESDVHELRRISSGGEVLWTVDPAVRVIAAASAVDQGVLVFGWAGPFGAPGTSTLAAFDDDGTPTWSHDENDLPDVLENALCPLLAHDAELGWLVGCVVSGRFGGDGLFRLHTFVDGSLAATVTIDAEFLERMQATGDGRVIVSSPASETESAFLASVDVSTGAIGWSNEHAGDDAPSFAVGPDVVAVLRDGALEGLDDLGGAAWTTVLSDDAECGRIGQDPEVVWADGTFLVAGIDPLYDVVVVHHVAQDGGLRCGDGVSAPASVVSRAGELLLATADAGAWVAARAYRGRCEPLALWMTRSSAR
jgi:hypothetical protein